MKQERNVTMSTNIYVTPTVYFATSARGLANSLFNRGGTASGTAKVLKQGIRFHLPNGEPFAFLVANPGQSPFFVSCARHPDGRIRYLYGITDEAEMRLGLRGMGYSAQRDAARNCWLKFRKNLES